MVPYVVHKDWPSHSEFFFRISGQNWCKTKIPQLYFFYPEFCYEECSKFCPNFWGLLVLCSLGKEDHWKFTRNPAIFHRRIPRQIQWKVARKVKNGVVPRPQRSKHHHWHGIWKVYGKHFGGNGSHSARNRARPAAWAQDLLVSQQHSNLVHGSVG